MQNKKMGKRLSTLAVTALLIVAVVLVNIAFTALAENKGWSIDLSDSSIYSLGEQSREVALSVDEEIILYNMNSNAAEFNEITEFLRRYASLNDHITLETVDPVSNPQYAQKFQDESRTVADGSVVVYAPGRERYRVLSLYDFFETNADYTAVTGFRGEQAVTSALVYVLSDSTPNVYFLTGHQEISMDDVPYLANYLRDVNYAVYEKSLLDGIPMTAADTLVVLSPKTDLAEEERDTLKTFLQNGGKMLMTNDAGIAPLENWDSLLGLYGLGWEDGMVIESESSGQWYQDTVNLLPTLVRHAITDAIIEQNMRVLLPVARAITLPQTAQQGVQIETLLRSSDSAYLYDATTGEPLQGADGPFALAVTVETENPSNPGDPGKIVLIGNSYFVSSTSFVSLSANLDFYLSSVKWLSEQKVNVSIVTKDLRGPTIEITNSYQQLAIIIIVLIVIPGGLLLAGLIVWLRRRHL